MRGDRSGRALILIELKLLRGELTSTVAAANAGCRGMEVVEKLQNGIATASAKTRYGKC